MSNITCLLINTQAKSKANLKYFCADFVNVLFTSLKEAFAALTLPILCAADYLEERLAEKKKPVIFDVTTHKYQPVHKNCNVMNIKSLPSFRQEKNNSIHKNIWLNYFANKLLSIKDKISFDNVRAESIILLNTVLLLGFFITLSDLGCPTAELSTGLLLHNIYYTTGYFPLTFGWNFVKEALSGRRLIFIFHNKIYISNRKKSFTKSGRRCSSQFWYRRKVPDIDLRFT